MALNFLSFFFFTLFFKMLFGVAFQSVMVELGSFRLDLDTSGEFSLSSQGLNLESSPLLLDISGTSPVLLCGSKVSSLSPWMPDLVPHVLKLQGTKKLRKQFSTQAQNVQSSATFHVWLTNVSGILIFGDTRSRCSEVQQSRIISPRIFILHT